MRTKKQALELISSMQFSPKIIIDVGVATGTDGLYEVWPNTSIVLVEALPKFQFQLEALAASLPSCELVLAFAGSAAGNIDIATAPDHVHAHQAAIDAPPDWPRATVPVLTVDELVASRISLQRDLQLVLKIDVDGAELDVLAGSHQTMSCDCVIIIEAALLDEENSRFARIVAYLHDAGYEPFDILEPLNRPADGLLWQVDLVFVRRESHLRSKRSYLIAI